MFMVKILAMTGGTFKRIVPGSSIAEARANALRDIQQSLGFLPPLQMITVTPTGVDEVI